MMRNFHNKKTNNRRHGTKQRRPLTVECLEARRLLAVTLSSQEFQQAVFDSTGSFSGSTRIFYTEFPTYRDDYSGQSNATISLNYTSPFVGSGVGSSFGGGSGRENYAPDASDFDNYGFTYVGSGSISDSGGTIERIHASGTVTYDDGSTSGQAINGNYSTGSLDISSVPFTADLSWSEPVNDGFGTGTTSGSWSGTLVPTDTTPFDLDVGPHFLSSDGEELFFFMSKSGPPQSAPSRGTPISNVRLYYSSTEDVAGISSGQLSNSLPIYWNHDELWGKIPKDDLDPSLGPYLLVVADDAVGEIDYENNVHPIMLGADLTIQSFNVDYYQIQGEKFADLTITVANDGLLDSDPTQLNIKASPTSLSSSGEDVTSIGLPAIAVDASHTVNLTQVSLAGIPDSSRYLKAHADDPDIISELDESNNVDDSEIPAEFTPSELDVDAPGFAYTTFRILEGILGGDPFTDALELAVETTITNTGYKTSEQANVFVFVDSEPVFDPHRETYRKLGEQTIGAMERNESMVLTFEDIQNPLEFPDDPGTGLPIYDSGYFIGVATDVEDLSVFNGSVVEFENGDNLQYEDGCETADTSHGILSLLADEFAFANPIGFGAGNVNYAQRHLRHFLGNSGNPLDYAANSDIAAYLANSDEFAGTIQRSHDRLEKEIIADLRMNGFASQGPSIVTVTKEFELDGPHVAYGLFGSSNGSITGTEMALAFGGFQSTDVSVTAQYELISRENSDGTTRVYLSVREAVFTITVGDNYTFDVSDIRKSPFDVMGRYTQMCGLSKAFDTSITTSVLRESFGLRLIGRFDSLDETSSLNLANGVAPESSLRFSQTAGGTTAIWAPDFSDELQTIDLAFTPHADSATPAAATHTFEVFADDGNAQQMLWSTDLADFTFAASGDVLGNSAGPQSFSIPVPANLFPAGTSYQLGFRLMTDGASSEQVELTLQELNVQQQSSRLGVSTATESEVRNSFQFGPDSNASDTLPLLIRNDGEAPITIDSININGDFALVMPPTTPLTVDPQTTFPIEVLATTATPGLGSLVLSADALADGILETALEVPSNTAPTFSPLGRLETDEDEGGVVYLLQASDEEAPDQTLSYRLVAGPSDLTVSESGIVVWEPEDLSAIRSELVTVAVSDNGFPSLESEMTFELVLNGPDRIVFAATRNDEQIELFQSDGTSAGTRLLKNVGGQQSSAPHELTVVGDDLYFAATGADGEVELFRTQQDGTTRRVKDLAGPISSDPHELIDFGGTLYFVATGPDGETELYSTDGTNVGTTRVKNLSGNTSSNPDDLVVMNNVLYFTAEDAVGQRELYRSDGTGPGTFRVKNLFGNTTSSAPSDLTVVGDTLYFVATTDTNDRELFKSDGTNAGTALVKDIAGEINGLPRSLTAFGNELFFRARGSDGQTELWKSDGSEAGTIQVTDLSGTVSSNPRGFTILGDELFFVATTSDQQAELHVTDGSAIGTMIVADLHGSTNALVGQPFALGDQLLFSATGNDGERELYASDGTAVGTRRIKDIGGTISSSPHNLAVVGHTLYFSATASNGEVELFSSDGTTSGTGLVKNLSGSPDPREIVSFSVTPPPVDTVALKTGSTVDGSRILGEWDSPVLPGISRSVGSERLGVLRASIADIVFSNHDNEDELLSQPYGTK